MHKPAIMPENQASNAIIRWEYVAGLLLVWLTLTFVNLHWGIDISYRDWFNLNKAQGLTVSLSNLDFSKDPAYFLTQAGFSGLVSFDIFFGALIFLCLSLKFSALLQVNKAPGILDVAPYLLVLGFLHEGIQMRIAIALSIALWAIICFAKNQRVLALLILAFACTFHISAAAFFLVFFLVFLYERFGLNVAIASALLTAFLAYTPFIPDLLIWVGEATHARFLTYAQGTIFKNQNSTGLFQYFSLFVIFLTVVVWKDYKPESLVWKKLYQIAITSGLLAIAILQVFRFNVVVSSRLADLLLLPVLLVLGAALTQLKLAKRYWTLSFLLLVLLSYCMARGYVSFHPPSIKAS